MSRSIKVSEAVYKELMNRQHVRETFSGTIQRLLALAELLERAEPIIQGQHEFLRWQQEKHEQEKAADG